MYISHIKYSIVETYCRFHIHLTNPRVEYNIENLKTLMVLIGLKKYCSGDHYMHSLDSFPKVKNLEDADSALWPAL